MTTPTDTVLNYLRRRADELRVEARQCQAASACSDSWQARQSDEQRYTRLIARAHALTAEADLLAEGATHAD